MACATSAKVIPIEAAKRHRNRSLITGLKRSLEFAKKHGRLPSPADFKPEVVK